VFVKPVDTSALDFGAQAGADATPAAMQDRFLKLLVAQLNNQDPMNPLDNAQMTTQMAQINTVTGLQTLNLTMQGISEQISAMQTLQGMSMIGRNVLCEGDSLSMEEGVGTGRFFLSDAASNVKVDVLDAGGKVLDTVELGAQDKGQGSFTWEGGKDIKESSGLRFRVTATNAEGKAIAAMPLASAKVLATGMEGGVLTLKLENGDTIRYADIFGVA